MAAFLSNAFIFYRTIIIIMFFIIIILFLLTIPIRIVGLMVVVFFFVVLYHRMSVTRFEIILYRVSGGLFIFIATAAKRSGEGLSIYL